MSFFCSSSSPSGNLVSKIAPRHVLSFLYSFEISRSKRFHPARESSSRRQIVSTTKGLEEWFISSLANAGNCRKHTRRSLQPSSLYIPHRPHGPKKVPQVHNVTFQRHQHTKAVEGIEEEDTDVAPNRTREELMALVDQYSGESYTDQLPVLELPRLYQPSDGPYITVSDKVEDEWPPPHQAWYADLETQTKLEKLNEGLKDHSKDPEEIYELYRALPEPRAPYLESKTRHRMLHHLAVVEYKDEHSMLRYLSVIDDMKGTAIPLNVFEWTSAISFAASYTARSTEVEVEAALVMWKEMEHIAGVKGSAATFNVLFDVACKAGKFTLAEMIHKEMLARGLELDRYHHVSMIFYHGLMKNGDAARAAYKALVEADEIVDTVVLNAMISALVQSHEAHAAENIYERMKKSHLERPGAKLQPEGFRARRLITRTLKTMARTSKADKTKREEFQRRSIIAPDRQTFQILLRHFAVQAGEMGKTAKFLEEMTLFDIAPHNVLFVPILTAFATHGGIRYTRWTESRLEAVWKSVKQALDDKVEGVDISRWLVMWAIRAFAKCSGKSRTVEVWEEIKQKWDPGEADLDFIMYELRLILNGPDMAKRKDDWVLGHSYNNKGHV